MELFGLFQACWFEMLFHGNQKKIQSRFHSQLAKKNGTDMYSLIGTKLLNIAGRLLAR